MLLEKGEPAPAPMIWLASADDHSSVGSVQNRHVFTQEMLLCWKLAPEFSVTFVSLEMSGAEGSQAFQQVWYYYNISVNDKSTTKAYFTPYLVYNSERIPRSI